MESILLKPLGLVRCYSINLAIVFVLAAPTAAVGPSYSACTEAGGSYAECQDGARLIYTYDAAHRLTAINDHKGNRVDYTLDAMGNRTAEEVRDPGGVLVKNIARVIDALNRLERITGAER